MSNQMNYNAQSFAAAVDLSTFQHHMVMLDSAGTINMPTGANPLVIEGVLENEPTSGQNGTVSYDGVTKIKVAGVYAIGTPLMAEYSSTTAMDCGRGTTAAAALNYTRARTLQASTAANQIVMCRLIDMVGANQGATGLTGVTGLVGTTGVQGTTGSQGATGVKGTTGVQGTTGGA